ncbi:acetyltransferase [Xylariaceae sp. FL0804]|nr:acetyltransferase [Xylariaceae sp. FL0804]
MSFRLDTLGTLDDVRSSYRYTVSTNSRFRTYLYILSETRKTPAGRPAAMATDPASAVPAPIVTTDKCAVRPWVPSDAAALAALANDPQLTATMRDSFPAPYTLAVAEGWIASCTAAEPMCHFAIVTPAGELCGSLGLQPPRGDSVYRGTRELGYWVGRPFWRRGIVGAAAKAFVRWAFANFPDTWRIEASVVEGNTASERALLGAGFTKEGTRRQAMIKHGVVMDDMIFGLVRQDVAGRQ